MALQLVTGPVNAAKAGVVLGLVRRWAREGRDPVLVVPTGPDADAYRRELLARGAGLLGVSVGPFGALEHRAREAAGIAAPRVGEVLRDRLLAAALADVPPRRPLHGAAERPGVRRRLLALLDELRERRVTVDALVDGLATLDVHEHGIHRALAEDLRAVLGGYLARLRGTAAGGPLGVAGAGDGRAALGGGDRVGVMVAVADAARTTWPGRPVALYGFDDLSPGQLRLLVALAERADVVLSLPFEDGRPGTAARRVLVDELRRALPAAGGLLDAGDALLDGLRVRAHRPGEVVLAGPTPGPRAGVPRLAADLFGRSPGEEPDAPGPGPGAAGGALDAAGAEGPDADAARPEAEDVVLLRAGDARAEAEQLAEALRDARAELGARTTCAVAVRDAAGVPGARIERELRAVGLPVVRRREVPVGTTPLGRTALAAVRLALGLGAGEDVGTLLRAFVVREVVRGDVARAEADVVDRFVVDRRRAGDRDPASWAAAAARSGVLRPAADEVRGLLSLVSRPDGPAAALELVGALADRWRTALAPPLPGRRPDDPASVDPARAARAVRDRIRELLAVHALGTDLLPTGPALVAALAEAAVAAGDAPGDPRGVEIAEPGALRGRQVDVLALAGLDHRAFPAPEPVDPLVDRRARDALHAAVRLEVRHRSDPVAAERLLFLELVARPTRRLLLSRPLADARGAEVPPSAFLADVHDALAPLRPRTPAPRGAAAVRPAGRTPTAVPGGLGTRVDEDGRSAVARALADHVRLSVREVEVLATSPADWLVGFVEARDDQPSPAAVREGLVAHAVLAAVLTGRAGVARYGDLDPDALEADARALLAEPRHDVARGLDAVQDRVARRRVAAGVVQVLRDLPVGGLRDARPLAVEQPLGELREAGPVDAATLTVGELPPIDLGDGVQARGRVDRIDLVPPDAKGRGGGIGVVDYKRGTTAARPPSRWVEEGDLQVALYAAAVAAALEEPVACGLYQPTVPGAAGVAHRAAGVRARRTWPTTTSGWEPGAVDALLSTQGDRARRVVGALRAGDLRTRRGLHAAAGDPARVRHPVLAREMR